MLPISSWVAAFTSMSSLTVLSCEPFAVVSRTPLAGASPMCRRSLDSSSLLTPSMTDLRWLARPLNIPKQWLHTADVVYVQDGQDFLQRAAKWASEEESSTSWRVGANMAHGHFLILDAVSTQ